MNDETKNWEGEIKTYKVVECNLDGTNERTLKGFTRLEFYVAKYVMRTGLMTQIARGCEVEWDTDTWDTDKMWYSTDENVRYELREDGEIDDLDAARWIKEDW